VPIEAASPAFKRKDALFVALPFATNAHSVAAKGIVKNGAL
jgi:hypothetical protein